MKMPVAGQLVGRFGKPRQQGVSWKGLFIQTANGTPVRSVADGTVVFADQLRGFGNAILIDHGGNYMTVYTGLSVIGKSVGSGVKAGDTIGNTEHWTAANPACTLKSDTWDAPKPASLGALNRATETDNKHEQPKNEEDCLASGRRHGRRRADAEHASLADKGESRCR